MLVQKKDACVTILSCIAGVIQKQQQLAKNRCLAVTEAWANLWKNA